MSGHVWQRFAVPSSLLLHLSDSLHNLATSIVNPEITALVLQAADVDTFYRLYQYIYTGTYDDFSTDAQEGLSECTSAAATPSGLSTIEAINRVEKQSEVSEPSVVKNCDEFQLPYSVRSIHEALRKLANSSLSPEKSATAPTAVCPTDRKLKTISSFLQNCDSWPCQCLDKFNHEHCSSDNGDLFLGHAKIWQLAEAYEINSLMDLARSRLARELSIWTVSPDSMADFGKLVRYLYNNCGGRGNALQRLVAQFTECVMDDVKGLEHWQDLVMEVPAFGLDLMDILCDSR